MACLIALSFFLLPFGIKESGKEAVEKTIEEQIIEAFPDAPVMLRIAYCESRFRQFNPDGSVFRGELNPKDTGLFQINERYHLAEAQKLGLDIYTTSGNIAYARILYDSQGTVPWNWSKGCWS